MSQAWTSEALEALSRNLDAVLRQDLCPERMAIPLLHFRSAHPSAVQTYAPLLNSAPAGLHAGAQARRVLAGLRDRLGRWGATLSGDSCPEKADVLFISHLVNSAQAAVAKDDPYFGVLPLSLDAMGLSCAIALIDQRPRQDDVAPIWQVSEKVPRLVLSARLGFRAESRIARDARRAAQSLLQGGDDCENIRHLAAEQARSGATRQSLRIARHVENLVRRLRPKSLVFTYEGHAWERLVIRAARRANPNILCCAVHHAILAPMQHAMTRRYGAEYDPDHIFTAGEAAADWLNSTHAFEGTPIGVLGSPRALKMPDAEKRTPQKTCLFVPEGMMDETAHLARAAFEVAQRRPDVECVIRLHPVLPRAQLMAAHPDLALTLPNLIWSAPAQSLAEDCAHARWCVYRGSSAVLTAMSYGAEPLYLGAEAEDLRIDPLRGREGFGQVAIDAEALCALLQGGPYDAQAQSLARRYAARYYTPLNPQVMFDAISPRI